MISTGAMVRLGKVLGNRMVDLQPTSRKLRDRALRIIREVLGCSPKRAQGLLRASGDQVKVAIVMGQKKLARKEAEACIAKGKRHLGEDRLGPWSGFGKRSGG